MYSFLEAMGVTFCFLIAGIAIIFAYYAAKELIQKLIKRLRDPYRCPNCGCIPLRFRSKRSNRKFSSNFCPHCGFDIMFSNLSDKKTVCDTCAMSEQDRDVCWKTCDAAAIVKTKDK